MVRAKFKLKSKRGELAFTPSHRKAAPEDDREEIYMSHRGSMTDQLNIFEQDFAGLDAEEALVWRIIRDRKGRANAVKADALAWQTGFDGVRVREIVSHLVTRHGNLIGSSTANPPGFYVITDSEELRRHVKSLRHRGIMCLVRAAALSKTSIEDIFQQGRLDIDGM